MGFNSARELADWIGISYAQTMREYLARLLQVKDHRVTLTIKPECLEMLTLEFQVNCTNLGQCGPFYVAASVGIHILDVNRSQLNLGKFLDIRVRDLRHQIHKEYYKVFGRGMPKEGQDVRPDIGGLHLTRPQATWQGAFKALANIGVAMAKAMDLMDKALDLWSKTDANSRGIHPEGVPLLGLEDKFYDLTKEHRQRKIRAELKRREDSRKLACQGDWLDD